MEQGTTAAAYLPDDLVVEILARLPAKSLCRFKCVSRRWRSLTSDPAHRTRLAQTLSGFFFKSSGHGWHFTGLPSSVTPLGGYYGGLSLVDATLSFLPSTYREIEILDSYNGLLLLSCSDEHASPPPFYVVCNPATREWVALPQPKYTDNCRGDIQVWHAAVGFDPVISLHFHVFQVVEDDDGMWCFIKAVEVYSSETGTWDVRECKPYWLKFLGRMTYFNGFLHLPVMYAAVASVDTKGQSWRLTQGQDNRYETGRGYVGHSQGRLLYVKNYPKDDVLSVYVFDDQESEEWALKNNVSKSDLLFEQWRHPMKPTYYIAGFHPDGDLIFFYDRTQKTLISYDMNRGNWHVVCALEDFAHAHHPFFPYVPWYSRGLASPNSASHSSIQG
ncbi:unnamed protein product [Urochloa decumbens]|uniref:F-box domain-containing protein n=1 Tax=Urochloa decumbens TaxID=240449 RepID=A0ABC9FPY2_9POAL